MSEAATVDAPVVILTEAAARRVTEIMKTEAPGSVLRVGVDGGGCSGFQYTYTVTTERGEDDLVLEREGATVLVSGGDRLLRLRFKLRRLKGSNCKEGSAITAEPSCF
jgi:Iron-sulphur cluster biosynthesis